MEKSSLYVAKCWWYKIFRLKDFVWRWKSRFKLDSQQGKKIVQTRNLKYLWWFWWPDHFSVISTICSELTSKPTTELNFRLYLLNIFVISHSSVVRESLPNRHLQFWSSIHSPTLISELNRTVWKLTSRKINRQFYETKHALEKIYFVVFCWFEKKSSLLTKVDT